MPATTPSTNPERPPYLAKAVTMGVAVGVFGISFGVLAVGAGLSVLQATMMSALVFTGASQFAAMGVIAAGGAVPTAIAGGLLLAVRNAAYGLAVEDRLPDRLWARALMAHLIIDETVALSLSVDEDDGRGALLAAGLSVLTFWTLGTFIGAAAGANITDPGALGLDAAFPASLLALLAPRLRERAALRTALYGAAIALVLTPLLPAGLPIMAAALAIVPELLRGKR